MTIAVAVSIIVPLVVALTAALVALYLKSIDRRSAVEERHASAREDAFDRLLASGDVAWLCRTEQVEQNPRITLPDHDAIAHAANQLFQMGLDRLKAHAHDFDAEAPMIATWFVAAFDDETIGPETFERIRDQLASRRRAETGLRKALTERGEKPLFERLRAGERPQRMPKGFGQLFYTEQPGEFMITGGGEEFAELFEQMMHHDQAMSDSRQTALTRSMDWAERGLWAWPPGSEPSIADSKE